MIIDLTEICEFSRKIPPEAFPVLARLAKVTEEVGEFAESTLVTNGYMYKNLKEPQAGELADIIITAVDTYLESNACTPVSILMDDLQIQLFNKFLKWKSKYPDIE